AAQARRSHGRDLFGCFLGWLVDHFRRWHSAVPISEEVRPIALQLLRLGNEAGAAFSERLFEARLPILLFVDVELCIIGGAGVLETRVAQHRMPAGIIISVEGFMEDEARRTVAVRRLGRNCPG